MTGTSDPTLNPTAVTPAVETGPVETGPVVAQHTNSAPATAVDLLHAIVAERPNGEVRPQQQQMVHLVEDAIKNKAHLLVQAGTGTGKSLGYLIPAIHSGKRVVISTATKQLGEQIVDEDMPVLADLIPKVGGSQFTYALIKGRNNYACFAADTQVITSDGDKAIADLLGTRPSLVDGHGSWVECDIESFGTQQIVELSLRRDDVGKIIRTTADHRWFVQESTNGSTEEVLTKDLMPGMTLMHQATPSVPDQGVAIRRSLVEVAAGLAVDDGSVLVPTSNDLHTDAALDRETVPGAAARRWIVESVLYTDDYEPVYCAVVPTTQSFVLVGNILTGNCKREIDSLVRLDAEGDTEVQDALFEDPTPRENSRRPSADDLKRLNALLQWADQTHTGDRSEAPAVQDRVWDQVSTDAAGCAGKACPFVEACFAERARADARDADVVVTNHAQVAQDLRSEFPLLGEYDVLVTDEVHELESYLSSAWGLEVAPSSMKHHAAQAIRKMSRDEKYEQARETGKKVLEDLDALSDMLDSVDAGLCPDLPENVGALLVEIAKKFRTIVDAFALCAGEKGISQSVSADRKGAGQKITELCHAVVAICGDMSDGTMVRWLESGHSSRGPALKVAPLWVGPQLMKLLDERTLIATSATMTVGGSFESFIRTLALREDITDDDGEVHPPRAFNAVDVGTPFDYDKQAILYIPDERFPAPVGQEREAHTTAVKDEVLALVKAAGGRTLALFTTRRGAEAAAAHLRLHVNTPVLCQGDAPPSQLIAEFKDDEHATLCATMGFWHGVNAPGATCTVVILDKTPFAPMNDPLMSARRKAVDDAGRRGFDEVYVAGASVMLSQGVGRLIRTATDKGVVAILDNRLQSKYYGRTMISSMPRMRIFRDRAIVEQALTRLAAAADAALLTSPAIRAGSPSQVAHSAKVAAAVGAAKTANTPPRRAAPKKANTSALSKQVRKTA